MNTKRHIIASGLGVVFRNGQAVLNGIDLTCDRGEFVAIIGPSGCGKSTLLRCVAGLQSPTSGSVSITSDQDRSHIGYVFQEASLLPWRTASDNVALPLEIEGGAIRHRAKQAEQALVSVGLGSADHAKLPHQLSGGMQMRVSLARALVNEPQLLLFDEPFAAIDDISRGQLNIELQRLWLAQTWTALFVTHNVSEAVFLGSRVLVMSQHPGEIQADISIDFEFPRDPSLRTSTDFASLCERLTGELRRAGGEER